MAATAADLHETIERLSAEIVELYWNIARQDPQPVGPGAYCGEHAAAWVAEAAVSGRDLPVNEATVRALSSARSTLVELHDFACAFHAA